MSVKKEIIRLDLDNDFLKAIIKSFNQYLIEESTGEINADLRFIIKMKSAYDLYPEERRALSSSKRGSRLFNTSNAVLVFYKNK